MSISIYDQTLGVMVPMLKNLDRIVSMAEAWAAEKEIEPAVLLQARLAPDMLTLIHQVRIATDVGKGAAARLTGTETPVWEDNESTFADVHARIDKALQYFAKFEPGQFDGAESRTVTLKLPFGTVDMQGDHYVLNFVLPNFYFHIATAYNILRHNGLQIGKLDFLNGGRHPGQPANGD